MCSLCNLSLSSRCKQEMASSSSLTARLVRGVLANKANRAAAFHSYSAEPSQPLNRSPKICNTALEAVACVQSGECTQRAVPSLVFLAGKEYKANAVEVKLVQGEERPRFWDFIGLLFGLHNRVPRSTSLLPYIRAYIEVVYNIDVAWGPSVTYTIIRKMYIVD